MWFRVLVFSCCTFVVLFGSQLRAQGLDTSVKAVIDSQGNIEYYVVHPPKRSSKTIKMANVFVKEALKLAVEGNMGMKDLFNEYPNARLIAGKEDAYFSVGMEQGGTAVYDGTIGYGGHTEFPGWGGKTIFLAQAEALKALPKSKFLNNLAKELFNHAKTIACGLSVRPDAIEGSADLGVIEFSAKWEMKNLCK